MSVRSDLEIEGLDRHTFCKAHSTPSVHAMRLSCRQSIGTCLSDQIESRDDHTDVLIELIDALLSDHHRPDAVFLDFLHAFDDVVACDLKLSHFLVSQSCPRLEGGVTNRWQNRARTPVGTNAVENKVVWEVRRCGAEIYLGFGLVVFVDIDAIGSNQFAIASRISCMCKCESTRTYNGGVKAMLNPVAQAIMSTSCKVPESSMMPLGTTLSMELCIGLTSNDSMSVGTTCLLKTRLTRFYEGF